MCGVIGHMGTLSFVRKSYTNMRIDEGHQTTWNLGSGSFMKAELAQKRKMTTGRDLDSAQSTFWGSFTEG